MNRNITIAALLLMLGQSAVALPRIAFEKADTVKTDTVKTDTAKVDSVPVRRAAPARRVCSACAT